MYDISLKRKWDNKNALDYARKEGKEEGMKEAMKSCFEGRRYMDLIRWKALKLISITPNMAG